MQEEQQTTNTQAPVATAPATPLWKDLLIPGAIVIAGLFIGVGLYGNGGGSNGGSGTAVAGAQTFQGLLYALVEEADVKERDFDACMEEDAVAALVQEDLDNASLTGGGGTPWTIVIGPTGKTYPINGALPAAAVEQVLELARTEADIESVEGDAYT